ncbi:hypothetical protein BBO99_00000872 [Phytophthora kernoviae]|uniref:Nudix hydrolase domain-containing protein n=2 Tax=Phytophthora kernoviae TaxID=325452 RepID=A0A3R7GV05_9STRA|nr:hypothetical protein G195_001535 [Phytophthora kernoviae 00238/432]KAG2531820.1 hypothetical protein JM16_000697 [Phytophthora kernoviae]KAG2532758.1 hypothetical protein JM18_000779 [Phytophthora kernoviae]RLN44441.1 hypothetical protein BBI17_000947 [Phytophthora kernoviae]RLN85051.1 hypothetical protein BBO99_00000872 [Phytophthora kernoviae]
MTSKTPKKKPSFPEVMDELQSRFLLNLPASELASSERLFFQIEQCFWFYEDFYADRFAHLQHVKLNDFARQMFAHCSMLKPLAHRCDELFQDFKTYQRQVPVVGCILLNTQRNKLLLVCNWKGTSWTFPRGKVNEGESDRDCARREVFEECGYDVGDSLSPTQYLELVQQEQRIRMFLCTDVPEDYAFAPQTRKEISTIEWFGFDSLPKKTWSVMPFMSRLKRWVKSSKKEKRTTSYDGVNDETFGNGKADFSVEEMFSVNERLTGQKFEYDGNPHDFGKPTSRPAATRANAPIFNKGLAPVQILTRPLSAPLKRVEEETTCPSPSPPRQSTGSTPFGSFQFDAVDIMAVVT